MDITKESLQILHERLVQPDTIEMNNDGSFNCSKSWNVSYGGTETIYETITAGHLTDDLDEMVKVRKDKEEVERLE